MRKQRPLWPWLLCVALLPAVLPLFLMILAWRLAMGAAEAVDNAIEAWNRSADSRP